MKINNKEFDVLQITLGEDLILLTLEQKDLSKFLKAVDLTQPVEIEGHEAFTIARSVSIREDDTFVFEADSDLDNDKVVEILTGEQGVTIKTAEAMRGQIEGMAEELPDDKAEETAWAFPAWSGNGIAYKTNDRVKYNGLLYRCIQAHTSQADWTPDTAVSLWVRTSDPQEEWPEWIQPTGAHDAYNKGDKVSHNSKHWVSDVDANTWEPGAYGWTEQ